MKIPCSNEHGHKTQTNNVTVDSSAQFAAVHVHQVLRLKGLQMLSVRNNVGLQMLSVRNNVGLQMLSVRNNVGLQMISVRNNVGLQMLSVRNKDVGSRNLVLSTFALLRYWL